MRAAADRQATRRLRLHALAAVLATGVAPAAGMDEADAYAAVRAAVWADPYTVLPRHEVTRSRLGPAGDVDGNLLLAASRRTLANTADLLDFPGGRKLIQPNGICFSGRWRIEHDTPWGGALRRGTDLRIIMRASVALGAIDVGQRRSLGLAGKLFPESGHESTISFLLLETLAGSLTPHFLDAEFVNEPPLGVPPLAPESIRLGLRIRTDAARADDGGGHRPDIGRRSVAALAATDADAAGPHWLRLRAAPGQPRPGHPDFRDGLQVGNYPGGRIEWTIEVAPAATSLAEASWLTAGTIVLDDSIVSGGCDRRLHFPHPAARD